MQLKYILIFPLSNILFISEIFCLIEDKLLIEYFRLKNIRRVAIFACDNDVKLKLLANLMQNNVFMINRNLNVINFDDFKDVSIDNGQQGFAMDGDCKNSIQILKKCAEEELLFDKYKWLIFSKNQTILLQDLENISIDVNAELSIAIELSLNWELFDVYNPSFTHGGSLQINNLGIWDRNKGFTFDDYINIPKYIRRKDLTGVTFTGTIVLLNEFRGELLDYLHNNEENKTIDNFTRYYFLLFHDIKNIHNFTLIVQLDHIYGAMDENGSFNGLVGSLQRKEIDFGLTPVYIKEDRIPYVDFLIPTYKMKCRFIFRNPKPALSVSGVFFSPLSNVVWLCTCAIMIMTAFLIRIAFKYEWQTERRLNDTKNYTEHDWSYIALLVFGGICQQDVPSIPNLYSSRIIVFMSIFFTFMLYQFYSGGIVSSLLSETQTNIKNLADLLHSQLRIGVEDVIYEHDYFDQTTDPVAIELYERKILHKKNNSAAFYDVYTGMDLVQKGDFAFHTDTSTGYAIIADKFSNEEICELGEVQLWPTKYTYGTMPKRSPFREIIIYSFQRMVEAGIVNRQRLKWTTKNPECIKIVDSSTIFVGIKDFFPAILFYSVGIIISLFIFAAEIWTCKNRDNLHNFVLNVHCK